jgi:hypothetical protein
VLSTHYDVIVLEQNGQSRPLSSPFLHPTDVVKTCSLVVVTIWLAGDQRLSLILEGSSSVFISFRNGRQTVLVIMCENGIWFTGLSKKFLQCRTAKILILAGADRLDKVDRSDAGAVYLMFPLFTARSYFLGQLILCR